MNAIVTTDESLTLRQLIGVVRSRWVLVLCMTVVGTAAGVAAGVFMRPVYRSTVLLMPVQSNERSGLRGSVLGGLGGGGGGASLISSLGFGSSNETATGEALALLQSRQFIEEFVQNHNLMPVLYPDKWDARAGTWRAGLERPPTPWKAFKLFTSNILDVSQDKKTNLVSVRVDWSDRNAAAAWANDLVDMVNDRVRARAIADADHTIAYLEQELKNAEAVEIRSALFNMIESQLKVKAVATVRKQYVFQVLDPAAPADQDVRLRPHPGMYTVMGFLIGFILAATVALLVGDSRRNVDAGQ
jgi:capsular polysaccharide biosynthesis protein